MPRQEPHRRRDDGNRDDHGDKHAAHLVGKLGDGRFGAGGLVHETYDLGERRIVADLRRAHLEVAGFVDRCADDGVTHLFLDGNALARQRGFIDCGRALEHHTVDRNALARPDDEHLTGLHLGSGNDALCAVALDGRGLGCKIHELCDRIGGFALGARFHGLAHGDERQDRAGGLKVQLHHIGMHRVHVHLSEADADAIDGIDAVQNGGAGAKRDERIHVRRALNERLAAADIILAVEKDDGNEQQKLRKRERHRVLHAEETLRQRPAHHVPHREVKERHGEDKREREAALHAAVGLLRGAEAALLTALRGGRCRAGLFMRRRAVARLFDRCNDLRGGERAFVVLDDHAVFQQIHTDLPHTVLPGNSFFHAA